MVEVVAGVIGRDAIDGAADRGLQSLAHAAGRVREVGPDLGKRRLNGVEVGRVAGQEEDPAAGGMGELVQRRSLVDREVVQDHDLPGVRVGTRTSGRGSMHA